VDALYKSTFTLLTLLYFTLPNLLLYWYLSLEKLGTVSFADMCRVCRSEGSAEKPLFHPCVCAGSIKYIHQDWYAVSRCFLIYFSKKIFGFFCLLCTATCESEVILTEQT